MSLINRFVRFLQANVQLQYVLLFLLAFGLFTYFHLDPTFADPDSFYHAKAAQLLAQQGAITEFPWLSATSLKYNFIDHHFLYHLFLIPFVFVFPPLVGLKIATIFFSSLAMVTIFWFLRQLKIRGAFWYVLFLLTVNPFVFRLNLAKAQALVLIFLFLIIYLIFTRRYLWLIFASCLYVWLYGGWPLLLLLVVIYGILNSLWEFYQPRSWLIFRAKNHKAYKQSLLLALSVGLGLLAGLFFSPYFPKNLAFYWEQSFKIAVLNYQNVIGVGGEWYPYQPADLLLAAFPFFILFALALICFVVSKKQPLNSWFFLILSLFFLALTFKSRRYIEYFIPIALCFAALSFNNNFELLKKYLTRWVPKSIIILTPVIIFLIFSPFFYQDLKAVKASYRDGFSFNKFASASLWLKENTNPGEIVFHSDWDEFPFLFYYNDQNYYLVGLDPTFMYFADPDLYRRWVKINTGESSVNLYSTIKDLFGARYVLVDLSSHQEFANNLANNFYFEEVFADKQTAIYRVN